MRIAIGQLWQETNTLNPLPTTRQDFEQFGVLRGADLVAQLENTNEVGGFIQSLRKWPQPVEIVGLVRLPAWPSGTATRETFDWILAEFTASLAAAGPVDAVLLALHGAMVADGHPDVEGEVLDALRSHLGSDVPLVATLDLHACVTERMVRAASALVLFHTAPHIDVFETGERGARVLERILLHGARPRTAYVRIPAVFPAERANTQDPQSVSFQFREQLQALEQRPEILTAGLATVQPWLDIPELGSAVLVTDAGDGRQAAQAAEALAAEVWRQRERYLPELTDIPAAVRAAWENPAGLTVLSDPADATTSGAPGDSTWLLAELLKYDWPRSALVTVVAPELVHKAQETGAGAQWTAEVGGRRDSRFARSLTLHLHVERLFDARFTLSGHLAKNLAIDMGPSALLRAGSVLIVATTRSGPHFAPELFRAAGCDPFAASVLVAKSPCGFRAAYAPVARQIFSVRAPGCAPTDFWNYEYQRVPRPLWPWDREMDYTPHAAIV